MLREREWQSEHIRFIAVKYEFIWSSGTAVAFAFTRCKQIFGNYCSSDWLSVLHVIFPISLDISMSHNNVR